MTLSERLTLILGFVLIVAMGVVCSGCVSSKKYRQDTVTTDKNWMAVVEFSEEVKTVLIRMDERLKALEARVQEANEREARSNRYSGMEKLAEESARETDRKLGLFPNSSEVRP